MKVAIEGCCHGSLDATYNSVANLEKRNGFSVDLLLIGGDFQAIRNHADMHCMSVPQKYRQLGEFYKYYIGRAKAPILTIVIGGNHEASNYLWELYHGGWLAPNIYYLGAAGCVNVNGVRVAGVSGIYKSDDYRTGHHERIPYNGNALRSVYHVRRYDITKLSGLTSPDIFMSHDWPRGIEHHGDLQGLLRQKPFFKEDIDSGRLGSPPLTELLKKLRPRRWFSAHLHVKFEARFLHDTDPGVAVESNPDEIAIDDEGFDSPTEAPAPEAPPAKDIPPPKTEATLFLALDKCLPRRQYLEVIDFVPDAGTVPSTVLSTDGKSDATLQSTEPPDVNAHTSQHSTPQEPAEPDLASYSLPTSFGKPTTSHHTPPTSTMPELTFDLEWLAICRAYHPFLSLQRTEIELPPEPKMKQLVNEAREWVEAHVGEGKKIADVQTFVKTAPGASDARRGQQVPLKWYTNSQTEAFCDLIGVENVINPAPKAPKNETPRSAVKSPGTKNM